MTIEIQTVWFIRLRVPGSVRVTVADVPKLQIWQQDPRSFH